MAMTRLVAEMRAVYRAAAMEQVAGMRREHEEVRSHVCQEVAGMRREHEEVRSHVWMHHRANEAFALALVSGAA